MRDGQQTTEDRATQLMQWKLEAESRNLAAKYKCLATGHQLLLRSKRNNPKNFAVDSYPRNVASKILHFNISRGQNICHYIDISYPAIEQIFAKIHPNIIKKNKQILFNDKEISSKKTNAGGKEIYAQPSNKGEGEGEFLLFLVNTSKKI